MDGRFIVPVLSRKALFRSHEHRYKQTRVKKSLPHHHQMSTTKQVKQLSSCPSHSSSKENALKATIHIPEPATTQLSKPQRAQSTRHLLYGASASASTFRVHEAIPQPIRGSAEQCIHKQGALEQTKLCGKHSEGYPVPRRSPEDATSQPKFSTIPRFTNTDEH